MQCGHIAFNPELLKGPEDCYIFVLLLLLYYLQLNIFGVCTEVSLLEAAIVNFYATQK